MADGVKKNRFASGLDNANGCITEEIADEIKRRYEIEEVTQTQLAMEYGIVQSTVCAIVREKWHTGEWRNRPSRIGVR